MTFLKRQSLLWLGTLLLLGGYSQSNVRAESGQETEAGGPEAYAPAQRELAKLGDGFLVWETHRTGRWSIWTMKLDGTGCKQLTPEDADRDQMAPKISPDGTRVVYLAYPKAALKVDGGPETRGDKAPLHIINSDGSGDRILVPDARVYSGWDRCVTWFNENELAYIGADGNTWQLDLPTGKSSLLIAHGERDSASWLPNSKKDFAVWSFNTFSPLDLQHQCVKPLPHMGGCMPYFTQDGEWGFWESYCGGPVGTVSLASWVLAGDRTLFTPTLNGSMMPKDRSYLYFPMYSSDRRLLAVGAKDHADQRGYGDANWNIFVVQTDPSSLAVIGKPIRYTFDPDCDRFPDVWQAPLPLGFQSAKTPFTATFKSPDGSPQVWDFGDGTAGNGAEVSHAYTKPDLYTVTATHAGQTVCGQVFVKDAQPPKALRAILKNPREIAVVFSEPVNFTNAVPSLKSHEKIEKVIPSADGRSVSLMLADQPKEGDALVLDGVTDLAQQPNRMPSTELALDVRVWPATRDGLIFLWQGGDKPNLLHDAEQGDRSCSIVAKGGAWYDHNRDMVFDGGAFEVQGLSEVLAKAVRKTKSLTIEISLAQPNHDDHSGPPDDDYLTQPHSILSYGLLEKDNKIVLAQDGREIEVMHAFDGGINPGFLALTYRDGRLMTYGGHNLSFGATEQGQFAVSVVTDTDKFPLNLDAFTSAPLWIGNNPENQGWRIQSGAGLRLIIRAIAIYDRALTGEELSNDYRGRVAIELARPPIEQTRVSAQLVAASRVPQPQDIAPYARALAVNEYEVRDPLDNAKRRRIRVAHWVMFDRKFQRIAQIPAKGDPGDPAKGGDCDLMELEPFEANPQLEGEYISDTLPLDPDIPLYYCPVVHRCTRGGTFKLALVGPFTLPGQGGVDLATDLEKDLITTDKAYQLTEGRAWKTVEIPRDSDGYFNIHKWFPETKGDCVYGHFYLKVPTARKGVVAVETEGGAKVWLNGQSVLSFQFQAGPGRGQKRGQVVLNAGWNEVLVKSTGTAKSWGFVCDFLDADGREMTDVEFTTDLGKPGQGVW